MMAWTYCACMLAWTYCARAGATGTADGMDILCMHAGMDILCMHDGKLCMHDGSPNLCTRVQDVRCRRYGVNLPERIPHQPSQTRRTSSCVGLRKRRGQGHIPTAHAQTAKCENIICGGRRTKKSEVLQRV